MEPKRLLLCRLPHVSLLAFHGPGLWSYSSLVPDLAYLVSNHPGDQVRSPAVHRTVAGGVNDEIGRQFGPVTQDDGMFRELFDVDAALQLDAAISNQFRSTNIDVVSRPASQVFMNRPESSSRNRAGNLPSRDDCRNRHRVPDRVVNRDLELVQNLVRSEANIRSL